MKHLGDYAASTVIYGKFTTYRPSTGAPFTLAGTPALSVYKDNSTTQSTTGVTLTVDFDSVTGLHHFAIDTSADGTFYSAGANFDIVVTTGTVDSVSAVGTVVAGFSIAKTAALRPTTSGRTLDVSAGGEAGLDWANVGSPTTTLNLSATTIKTATDVEADTADIQSRIPASLVSGRIDASVGFMAADVMTAAAAAADLTTELQSGLATSSALSTVAGYIDTEVAAIITTLGTPAGPSVSADIAAVKADSAAILIDTGTIDARIPAALVGGRMDSNVQAMATGVVSASALATDAVNEIADGLLDRADAIETGLTLRNAMRLEVAAAAGKVSGAATTTVVLRNAVADTKARITATVDADGNRSAITTDLT